MHLKATMVLQFPASQPTLKTTRCHCCSRHGLSPRDKAIRHNDARCLWIQDKIHCGDVRVSIIANKQHPRDMLGAYMDRATIERHMTLHAMFKKEFQRNAEPRPLHNSQINTTNQRNMIPTLKPTQRATEDAQTPNNMLYN